MSATNIITLNSVNYSVVGPMKISGKPRYAPKLVTGDRTKDSDEDRSYHTWSDFTGGIGVRDMTEGTLDDFRCYWASGVNIDHPKNLVLGPLNTNTGTIATMDMAQAVDAKNVLYAVFGNGLYFWRHNDLGWSTVISGTFTSGTTDAIYHNGYTYFALGKDFLRHTPGAISLQWGSAVAGAAVPCDYFTVWDNKLWAIDYTGQLKVSSDDGATWENNALLQLDNDSVTGLIVYDDVYGNSIIYVGTKQGLYTHDAANEIFVKTRFQFPEHKYGCKGMAVWRGALYVSVGMDVYEYRITGGGVELTPIGLQYNMALPSNYTGNIVSLAASYNNLYASVDCSDRVAQALYVANPMSSTVAPDNSGYSYITKWNGVGWSVVKISGSTDDQPRVLHVSHQDGKYRLYYYMSDSVYYQTLEDKLVNPVEVGDYTHESSGEIITPWFDANNDSSIKTALRTIAYTDGCSANETVTITYQINNAADGDSWTAHATITSDGETSTSFGSSKGIEIYNIRFKAALARGSTTTNTPNLKSLTLEYLKIPDGKHDYRFVIDVRRSAGSNAPETRRDSLNTAYETKTLVPFTYNKDTKTTPKYVSVVSYDAIEDVKVNPDGILYDVHLKEM